MSRTPGGIAGSYAQSARPASGGGINAAPTIHGRYSSRYLPYALLDFDKVQVFVDAVSGSPQNPYWPGENTSYKFDVSRATELIAQIYLRNPNARPGAGRSEDIFLGIVRVNPRFEEVKRYVEDPKASKKDRERGMAAFTQQERQMGQVGSEWLDVAFGTGSLKIGVVFVENQHRTLTIEDFELLKVVGKGSFGKVMQVRYARTRLSELEGGFANAVIGKMIPIESTLSRRSARPTSSPDLRSRTHLLSAQCWPRSIIRSLSPSSFRFNPLKSSTLCWPSSMVESFFITCSASSASMSTEQGFIPLNFFAPWSVYTVSTLSTGISNQRIFSLIILDILRYAILDSARWT